MLNNNFDWGLLEKNQEFLSTVKKEILTDKVYEKFFTVEENDVVVDIGASVGPFSFSVLDKKPKHIFCLEPHVDLFKVLNKNLNFKNITCINAGLLEKNGIVDWKGIYNPDSMDMWSINCSVNGITFNSLLKDYNIEKIDFLKIDCEGGEYYFFDDNNLSWIFNNVKKIAGEWHFHNLELKNKFRNFRDNFLAKIPDKNLNVYSMDNIDIKQNLWTDWFIDYYSCIMIYVNNEGIKMNNEYYVDNSPNENWGSINTNKFKIKSNLDKRLFVVDNFYEDPDSVRDFALQQWYFDDQGYLGMRTRKQFFFEGVKERFEEIIGRKIIRWEEQSMNGRFQTCKAGTPLVYHCDEENGKTLWAGMVYLTPNAPYESGTSFYAHKKTGVRHNSHPDIVQCFNQKTFLDGTPYEMVDTVGNVYNRLVIFDGGMIHAPSAYFGWDIPSSRLFHMYFFN